MDIEIKNISERFLADLNILLESADKKLPDIGLLWHSKNVATYSQMIYENLPDYEKKEWRIPGTEEVIESSWIYKCGYYHDIGKTIIMRFHEGMLEKEFWDAVDRVNIKEHTSFGCITLQIIAAATGNLADIDTPLFKMMSDACLYHHERMDGSGYMKMSGIHIPKISSLVAVADCFSAGLETRPYKEHKAAALLLRELKELPLNQIYVNALEKGILLSYS